MFTTSNRTSYAFAVIDWLNGLAETGQYGKQLWLRVNGVPVKSDETSDDVLKSVKEMLTDGEL